MIKQIIRGVVILTGAVALAACSSMGGTAAKNGRSYAGKGAQSYGIGQQASFRGRGDNVNDLLSKRVFYFNFDNNEVNPNDIVALQAQAEYLANHPNLKVRIEGNTDSQGSREYNIGLAERRAEAVANILGLNHVAKQQLVVVSYGEERPAALGHTEVAYSKNRRARLVYEG